jgi:small-conductance mechanosensitive channel
VVEVAGRREVAAAAWVAVEGKHSPCDSIQFYPQEETVELAPAAVVPGRSRPFSAWLSYGKPNQACDCGRPLAPALSYGYLQPGLIEDYAKREVQPDSTRNVDMLRSCKRLASSFAAVAWLFVSVLTVLAVQNPSEVQAAETPSAGDVVEEAPLVVWNRTIFVFRAPFEQRSPAQRAAAAKARVEALPEFGPWTIETKPATLGPVSGVLISVNQQPVFGVIPGDLNREAGETLEQAAGQAADRLRGFLEAREQQRNLPFVLRAVGFAVIATLLFVGAVWLTLKLQKRLVLHLQRIVDKSERLRIGGVDVRSHVVSFERVVIRFLVLVALVLLTYLWLMYELMRFPYTQPWGERLSSFLVELFKQLGQGILSSLPDLFTVVVILALTRVIVRLVVGFFRGVEHGTFGFYGFQPETARATRRLFVFVIWIFALTVAYPYIPGSNTEGFKGIGVLAGLVVSLGSAGLVNQVMSGLVIVYSRAFRVNDYVSIGETEGVVSDMGVLSTKLVTVQREEVIIPNATLVGMTAVNYTRLAKDQGSVASTSVTIGYDAPWRQVHSMLLVAAGRTAGVCQQPPPRVLQRSLGDFYVEYRLLVHLLPLERPEERPLVLSELHAQIQDVFNEHGVQIMSPHFMLQPHRPVVVPKSDWFPAPASSSSAEELPRVGVDSRRTG